jgi:hypothetical protein
MFRGELSGKSEGPAGPVADADLRRLWRALEDRAQEMLRRDDTPPPPAPANEPRKGERKSETGREARPAGPSTQIGLRLKAAQLASLDEWIQRQAEPKPTRPEAIRRLLECSFEAERTVAALAVSESVTEPHGELRMTRLRRLVEELLYHGLTDAAKQAAEIVRSIEQGEPIGARRED